MGIQQLKKYLSPQTKTAILATFSKVFGKPLRYISDTYEKVRNPILENPPPAKNGWSVIVISGGRNKEMLQHFVTSVYDELRGSEYEIIVVGPPNIDLSYLGKEVHLVHAPWKELSLWTVPFAISKKKNFGAKHAKYDKVVISHDYLHFLPGWKKGYDAFGDFIVAQNVVLDQDNVRHKDWVTWDYPGVGVGLLPYTHECSQYMTMGGNYLVVKRDFFLENPMDEKLRWGESEDVKWAFSVRNKIKFKFNPESSVKYSKYKKGVYGPWLEGTRKLEVILKQKIL